MENTLRQQIYDRYIQTLAGHACQVASAQSRWMDLRKLECDRLANQVLQQLGDPGSKKEPVLYDRDWLTEFALGDITRCLGNEFAIYQGRKSPRIPNGDLMLITRVKSIEGNRGNFDNVSTITAEYDVPADGWFFNGQNSKETPLSILMEIALQPCGVLSAWLHTQLRYPDIDFSFRNLDGSIKLHEPVETRGNKIQTKATLDSTSFSGSTIIQHFTFVLSIEGHVFLSGNTTFGYFSESTMLTQVGLDNGARSKAPGDLPENNSSLTEISHLSDDPNYELPHNKLRMIESISVGTIGSGSGYISAIRKNDPADWYYKNHFLGDPVMPGSLGIEAIVQAFRSGIHSLFGSISPVRLAAGYEMIWKYRGQVLPSNSQVQVDVTISGIQKTTNGTVFLGSANLRADDLRIYEVQNLALLQQPEDY